MEKLIANAIVTENDQMTKWISAISFESVIDVNGENLWGVSLLFFLTLYLTAAFFNLYMLKKRGGDYGFE